MVRRLKNNVLQLFNGRLVISPFHRSDGPLKDGIHHEGSQAVLWLEYVQNIRQVFSRFLCMNKAELAHEKQCQQNDHDMSFPLYKIKPPPASVTKSPPRT